MANEVFKPFPSCTVNKLGIKNYQKTLETGYQVSIQANQEVFFGLTCKQEIEFKSCFPCPNIKREREKKGRFFVLFGQNCLFRR